MIRPEHPFDIRPDLGKAETTKAETTTAETVIRPKQLARNEIQLPLQNGLYRLSQFLSS